MTSRTPRPAVSQSPPRAPGLPLLGNTIDLVRDPLGFFVRSYEELGPIFLVGAPGRTYVVLAGPEANRLFLDWEERHIESAPVYKPYVEDLGTERVLIAMDGEPHREYRRWLRPGLTREAIKPHISAMIAAAEEYIDRWRPGDSLNVTDVMQFLVSQMSGIALAGCPVEGHFKDAKTFAHAYLGAGVGSFPGFLRSAPGYRRARRRFLAFLRTLISRHRDDAPNGRSPDLIDLLLAGPTPEVQSLSEADIIASAHMPYTNSLVYVAATCGFMLYELLKHPEVLKQVRSEVDELFADGLPSLSALRRTKWLRATLLETQRLHPIAISLPRYVHSSFEFEGYSIEADSLTLTATAVTHFLPGYFPDPYRFDVSRYWAPRSEHRQPGALVPYGLGPHVCLSAGIVNALVMLTIGSLLRHFEFAIQPDDYELRISVAPFPAPARNFKISVSERRSKETAPSRPSRMAQPDLDDVLAELDAVGLSQAVRQATRRRFDPGAFIIRQGDHADALYIITSGSVEVVKEITEEEAKVVARLSVDDFFGEIGLLQGVPRTASVRAISTVDTIVLEREAFVSLVAETDMTSGEIAAIMHRRLTSTTLATALPKLSLEQIAELSPRFELLTVDPGTIIIRQGDPADRFYIVVQGQVEVFNEHPDGREISLGRLGEGEYFGEIGLLQSRPRNATVRASGVDNTVVMALGRDDFLAMMAGSDETGDQVALRMAERLTELINARGDLE